MSRCGRLVSAVGLCCLVAFPLCFSAPPAQPSSIDYLYPEAFRTATWIQVPLPSNQVSLAKLRIITANRKWKVEICGSASNPATCVNALASSDPRGVGWRGDFASTAWSQTYQDVDAVKTLHLRVTPLAGACIIFRIQVEATPTP